ncbi:MAG TPA: DUF1559 domain-containing protein [Abditibacteriaceae bacterium]
MMRVLKSFGGNLFGLGALSLVTAAILFPVFVRARHNARRSSCQSNLKQISLGMLQYQQDYDERFPPVASASKAVVEAALQKKQRSAYDAPDVPSYGWLDLLDPYLQDTSMYQCPSESHEPAKPLRSTSRGFSDYWMNGRWSGANSAKLVDTYRLIMLGDGDSRDSNSTSRYSKSSIVIENSESPWTERHLGGANYAFVDGHVKWLQRKAVSTTPGANHTFATK